MYKKIICAFFAITSFCHGQNCDSPYTACEISKLVWGEYEESIKALQNAHDLGYSQPVYYYLVGYNNACLMIYKKINFID